MLPDIERFPCYTGLDPDPAPVRADSDGECPRSPSMCAERIRTDLAELVAAAGLLRERKLPYPNAMAGHFARLLGLYRGDSSRIWSIDAAHKPYLSA
ncbi:MAG TPA: hypothetical protein VFX70_02890 [Mycobacteriales bacterium]|nr:hypothetical protein [Mycobacteriales bacterium]